ncbi:acyl-CoA Delta-9 desaturase isoform X2 [Bacillus rossius redtenbacheri]
MSTGDAKPGGGTDAAPGTDKAPPPAPPPRAKRDIKWPMVLFHIHLHVGAVYGLFVVFRDAYVCTSLFAAVLAMVSLLGVTAGAHRLWAHRSYQASTPLRIFLALCHTAVGQGSIYDWVLDHRIHHKHFGTENDPYNHKRGMYYAHVVSRVETAHPHREEMEKAVDMSDLDADGVVMFQKRFYWLLMPVLCFLLPINAPVEYWGETIISSFFVVGCLRYCVTLHLAWLINTSVCIWGIDPENKASADSNLVFVLTKSYWPFYHYLLPWDYNCGEYGSYEDGFTTAMIRVWAVLGWAYGLRTIDSNSVKSAVHTSVKTGRDIKECLEEEGHKMADILHLKKLQ